MSERQRHGEDGYDDGQPESGQAGKAPDEDPQAEGIDEREFSETAPVREPIDTDHVDRLRAAATLNMVYTFAASAVGIRDVEAAKARVLIEAIMRLLLDSEPLPGGRWTIELLREKGNQSRGHFTDFMDIRLHVAAQLAIRALVVCSGRSVLHEEYFVRPVRTGTRQKTSTAGEREANASSFVHLDGLVLGCSDRVLTASGWSYVAGTPDSRAHRAANTERIKDFDAQVKALFSTDAQDRPLPAALIERFATAKVRYPATPHEALGWQLTLADCVEASVRNTADSAFDALRLPDGRAVTKSRFLAAGFSRRLVIRALPHGPSAPGRASSDTDHPGTDHELHHAVRSHGRQALLYAGAIHEPHSKELWGDEPTINELPDALFLGVEPSGTALGRLRFDPESGELRRMLADEGAVVERWQLIDLDLEAAAALLARSDLEWPVECLDRQETSARPGKIQAPKIRSKTGILHLIRVAVALIVHDEREGRLGPDDRPTPPAPD